MQDLMDLEAWWDLVLAEPPVLGESDPAELTVSGRLDLLGQVQAARAHLAAVEAELLVSIAGSTPVARELTIDDPDRGPRSLTVTDETVDLIAAATRRSGGTVRRLVDAARALHGPLRLTAEALRSGRITPEHADTLVRATHGLSDDDTARIQARVLPRAARLTPAQTLTVARRERARIDPSGEEDARQRARAHIGVRIWAEDDGLACLQARLPLADAARVHEAIEAGAHSTHADGLVPADGTMGERRAAVLVAALCGPAGGSRTADRIEVQVTVDLATLAGLDDAPATVALGSAPAEPITAPALRELLSDTDAAIVLRRLVTDPVSGCVLDRGRTTYRVPEDLRALIAARDETCSFPGCMRSAQSCDIDHVLPWTDGGTTSSHNLTPMCRRHHLLKTHGRWSIEDRRPDGSTVWRGPDGAGYVSYPLRLPPDTGPATEPPFHPALRRAG